MTDKNLEMAKKIATEVAKKGGRTFLVGGIVRDNILGIANKDVDIEIHGITPEVLREILNTLGDVMEMGASFGILGLKGFDVDIAMPRTERATGMGHKDFDVFVNPFLGTKKAALRRDFTINALMMDILTNEIIDEFGGVEDLHNGIIRHVNDVTFVEDPLRVLRAAQFAARFGFAIAPETIELAKTMNLTKLPRERVFSELEKALVKGTKPSTFFRTLEEMGHLGFWFPEVKNLRGIAQNPLYHPEGDVFEHTMMVLDYAVSLKHDTTNPVGFMLTALAHDFGKVVATTTDKDGVVRAIGHETAGLPLVEAFMDRVVNEVKLKKYVLSLVENHMKPNHMATNGSRPKKTNTMFDEVVSPHDLVLFAEADHMGRKNPTDYTTTKVFLRERLERFEKLSEIPEVMGKDLVKAGLKPGPHFSEALAMAHKLHLAEVSFANALPQVIAIANKASRTV